MLHRPSVLSSVMPTTVLESTNSSESVVPTIAQDNVVDSIPVKEPDVSKDKQFKILPRKRLKPAVNLNAARRRKEIKDTHVENSCEDSSNTSSEINLVKTSPVANLDIANVNLTATNKNQTVNENDTNSINHESETAVSSIVCNENEKCKDTNVQSPCTVLLPEKQESLQPIVHDSDNKPSNSESANSKPKNVIHNSCTIKRRVIPRPNIAQVRRSKIVNPTENKSIEVSNTPKSTEEKIDTVVTCTEISQDNTGSGEDTENSLVTLLAEDNGKDPEKSSSVCSDTVFEDLESVEDETCSTQEEEISETKKDVNNVRYKRNISVSAQRISEAKRNFGSRFANKPPDRNSLRMLDLIFYNPTTNPMKSNQEQGKEIVTENSTEIGNRLVEENVDNPDEENSDIEDNIPAPRVKVGPDGELILDEQSLVIETTESKRSRKEIANLTVVIDSGTSTTYGTYSKKKKIRNDWNERDTLRFYRALQTFGTDFSLMQTLFPSRTRLGLKAKFKKEERIHGDLVEKALHSPLPFDSTDFDDEPENDPSKSQENEKKPSKKKRKALSGLGFDEEDANIRNKKRRKKASPKLFPDKMPHSKENKSCMSNSENTCEKNDTQEEQNETTEIRKTWNMRPRQKEPSDAGIDIFDSESESELRGTGENDTVIVKGNATNLSQDDLNQPGILSDITQFESNNRQDSGFEDCSNETISHNVCENGLPSFQDLPLSSIKPGSFVLFTTECPDKPGFRVCNVYMVQPPSNTNNNAVPEHNVTIEHTDGVPNSEPTDRPTLSCNLPVAPEESLPS